MSSLFSNSFLTTLQKITNYETEINVNNFPIKSYKYFSCVGTQLCLINCSFVNSSYSINYNNSIDSTLGNNRILCNERQGVYYALNGSSISQAKIKILSDIPSNEPISLFFTFYESQPTELPQKIVDMYAGRLPPGKHTYRADPPIKSSGRCCLIANINTTILSSFIVAKPYILAVKDNQPTNWDYRQIIATSQDYLQYYECGNNIIDFTLTSDEQDDIEFVFIFY